MPNKFTTKADLIAEPVHKRSTTEVAAEVLDHILRMPNRDMQVDAVTTFCKACIREGRADTDAQTHDELTVLRSDNIELQREVVMVAGQIEALRAEATQLKLDKEHWLSLYIQTTEGYPAPTKEESNG